MDSENSQKNTNNSTHDQMVECKQLEQQNILTVLLGVDLLDLPQCLCTDKVPFTLKTVQQFNAVKKSILYSMYEPSTYFKFLRRYRPHVCCKNFKNGFSLVTNEFIGITWTQEAKCFILVKNDVIVCSNCNCGKALLGCCLHVGATLMCLEFILSRTNVATTVLQPFNATELNDIYSKLLNSTDSSFPEFMLMDSESSYISTKSEPQ